MKFEANLKKVIIVSALLLIGGDISLLFAAQGTLGDMPPVAATPQPPSAPALPLPVIGGASQPVQQQLPQTQPLAPPQQVASMADPSAGMSGADLGQDATNEAAFNAMAKNALPMSPDQIQRLRQLFSASQLAASTMPGTPPRPGTTSKLVNLTPGAPPPVIRLAQGFVTSLVFIDATGAPWPIEYYSVGDPAIFNIQWNKSSNILMIQSTSLYKYGNLAVKLQGLGTPVMLTLIPGQKALDYRVDLRIQGQGPHAIAAPSGDGLPGGANPDLLGVLDGIPPAGSKTLTVSGGPAQAWSLNDTLYIRTRLTLLSPGWISTMSSADGTKAYEMQKAPNLLVSMNGKVISLKIEGL